MSQTSASGLRVIVTRSQARAFLADGEWLRRAYDREGDTQIARYLGVSDDTVRRARLRLGIPSRPRGRQRGDRGRRLSATGTLGQPKSARQLIQERMRDQANPESGQPAAVSEQMLASRFKALVEAFSDGERVDQLAALIELAAGCGLVYDHLQRLEAA